MDVHDREARAKMGRAYPKPTVPEPVTIIVQRIEGRHDVRPARDGKEVNGEPR
jgi:hypothetical protein